MRTEHLHQTLSPPAHAALFDGLRRQAEREHRDAVHGVGRNWPSRLHALARRLAALRWRSARSVRLLEV